MNCLHQAATAWAYAARVARDSVSRADEAKRDERSTPVDDVVRELEEIIAVSKFVCRSLGVQVPRSFSWEGIETRAPRNPPGAATVVSLLELAAEHARAARAPGLVAVASCTGSLLDSVLVAGGDVDVRELRARVAGRPTRRPRKRACVA